MPSKKYVFATLIVTLSFGAYAQEENGTARDGEPQEERRIKTFTELDTDRNGTLSKNELEQDDMDVDFEKIDTNEDGEVSRNEYFQYHRQ